MKAVCVFLIKLYQNFISPLLLPRCRYYPTCSSYMVDSLQKYGVFKGLLKGMYRIIRCNPFSSGGHDPA